MKRLKKIKNAIIFSILTVLCLSFITVDVQAKKVTCKLNEDYLLQKFQPAFTQQGNGKFTLKLTKDAKHDGKTIKFKVTKVNGGTPPSDLKDKEIYYGKNIKDIDVLNNLKSGEYTITLHSKDTGSCEEFENSCPSKSKKITDATQCTTEISLDVTIEAEKDQFIESVNLQDVTETGTWNYEEEIKCDNSELEQYRQESSYSYTGTRKHGIFKSRFCYAKIAAVKEGKDIDIGSADKIPDGKQPATLKCNEYILTKADVTSSDGIEGKIKGTSVTRLTEQDMADGYVNASYHFATGTKTYKTDTGYIRHLDPSTTDEGPVLSCKLQCVESVKVLYEAPVASKAGFCFDYKVKVESYVNCSLKEKPAKPVKSDYEYCYPSPICAHSGSGGVTYYLQGGPNEDYEACIQDCDGGKYTQSCSNKCYEKVYSSMDNASKLTAVNEPEYKVSRLKEEVLTIDGSEGKKFSLAECKKKVSNGCYYRTKGGVKFSANKNGRGSSTYAPGTWYIKAGAPNHYKYNDHTYIVPWKDGFYRHNYGGGDFCHDSCHWVEGKCKGKYLNAGSGQLEEDWQAALDLYDSIIASCKAAASCTTSTAEFTISAEYQNETANYFVDYPSGSVQTDKTHSETDKVNSNNSSDACNANTNNDTTACLKQNKLVNNDNNKFNISKLEKCNKTKSTIMDYAGCYVCSDAKNYYMTEWTFPGTYVNKKTGEISFSSKAGDDAWREESGKFCIPLDTKNVNPKWWLWYMKKTYPNNSYTTIEEFTTNCGSQLYEKTESQLKSASKSETRKYNIHAEATNFGYYKWHINMECFYAINDSAKTVTSLSNSDENKCKTTSTNYRVRDVDLTNMFPAKDGGEGSRTPGFNWTSQATITYDKDPNVATNPSNLREAIQKRGTTIYDNDGKYLDYEFYLTPATLKYIRGESKDKAYNKLFDESDEYNKFNLCGRNVYYSPFIDKVISYAKQGTRINESGICCSNYDASTGKCENFTVVE